MAFRFLADENFHTNIVRGIRLRLPNLDLVRIQQTGLLGADDPTILMWTAENNRILLTHDRATMADFAYERVAKSHPMPGVLIFRRRLPIREAIEELQLIVQCTQPGDWNNLVAYVPL